MDVVLRKLMWRGQSPVLVLRAPDEVKGIVAAFGVPVHTAAKGRYGFALAFAKSLAEVDALAGTTKRALEDDAVFWVAYPKGTSKKYPKLDINRDTGHARMDQHWFEGVSLVALDDDWSAMRFKRRT